MTANGGNFKVTLDTTQHDELQDVVSASAMSHTMYKIGKYWYFAQIWFTRSFSRRHYWKTEITTWPWIWLQSTSFACLMCEAPHRLQWKMQRMDFYNIWDISPWWCRPQLQWNHLNGLVHCSRIKNRCMDNGYKKIDFFTAFSELIEFSTTFFLSIRTSYLMCNRHIC